MNTITVEFWMLVSGGFAVITSLCLAFFALVRIIVSQFKTHVDSKFTALEQSRAEDKTHIDNKFTALEKHREEDGKRWEQRRAEDQGHLDEKFKALQASNNQQTSELQELKTKLPIQYVLREDWIRLVSRIDYQYEELRKDLTELLGEVKSLGKGDK